MGLLHSWHWPSWGEVTLPLINPLCFAPTLTSMMAYGRRVLPRIMVSNAFGFLLNWLKPYGFMPMRHPLSSCSTASIAGRLWVLAGAGRILGVFVVHARTNLSPHSFGSVTTVELCTLMVCLT